MESANGANAIILEHINDSRVVKSKLLDGGLSGSVVKHDTEDGLSYVCKSYNDLSRNWEIEREGFALNELSSLGVKTPSPAFVFDKDGHRLLLMPFIEGRSLMEDLMKSQLDPTELDLFVKVITKVHLAPTGGFVKHMDKKIEVHHWLGEVLDRLEKKALYISTSTYKPIFDWLRKKQKFIHVGTLSVLHGDYHPGNLIKTNEGVVLIDVVYDIGDYRMDLGWTYAISRMMKTEAFFDSFLEKYEEERAMKVQDLDYFVVLVLMKWLIEVFEPIVMNDRIDEMSKVGIEDMISKFIGIAKEKMA